MRTLLFLSFFLFLPPLAAGEEQLWRAEIPSFLLREAGPTLATLDVVSLAEGDGVTVVHIWETAQRAALLADTASSLRAIPLKLAATPAYRTLDEMSAALDAIVEKIPEYAKTYTIGSSIEGRDIRALKLSASPAANLTGPPEIVFVGLHHAREWISGEVTLRLAEFIADHIGDMPRIRAIVEATELWFIPVLNPDGYLYTHTTDRMWRGNRRLHPDGSYGVDLNRNYDAAWVENGYVHGAAPFSEPETRALRDLVIAPDGGTALTDMPRGLISYHSYAQLILYPWSSQPDPAPTADLMQTTAAKMADLMLFTGGALYGVKQAYGLYAAPIFGECGEWFYTATGRATPLLIELRPAPDDDTAFALDPVYIEPTARENIAAALYFIESILYDSVDIDTDVNGNGTADYLEVPDALLPDEDTIDISDSSDESELSDDDPPPDTTPDADTPVVPRPHGDGCSLTVI